MPFGHSHLPPHPQGASFALRSRAVGVFPGSCCRGQRRCEPSSARPGAGVFSRVRPGPGSEGLWVCAGAAAWSPGAARTPSRWAPAGVPAVPAAPRPRRRSAAGRSARTRSGPRGGPSAFAPRAPAPRRQRPCSFCPKAPFGVRFIWRRFAANPPQRPPCAWPWPQSPAAYGVLKTPFHASLPIICGVSWEEGDLWSPPPAPPPERQSVCLWGVGSVGSSLCVPCSLNSTSRRKSIRNTDVSTFSGCARYWQFISLTVAMSL